MPSSDSPSDCPQRLAYSVKEAVKVSSLGRTTLYALISAGKLPTVKVGQRTLIRRTDLEGLLKSGT